MRRPAGIHRFSRFQFIPNELAETCGRLIGSYHAIHGYAGLPDMLWSSDARNVIESDEELTKAFKLASKVRGAKRANDAFVLLATIVMSLEVLARDYASWGKRFHEAQRAAEEVLGGIPLQPRAWLMELYLYPAPGAGRELSAAEMRSPTEDDAT
jgi:hypothetical protein